MIPDKPGQIVRLNNNELGRKYFIQKIHSDFYNCSALLKPIFEEKNSYRLNYVPLKDLDIVELNYADFLNRNIKIMEGGYLYSGKVNSLPQIDSSFDVAFERGCIYTNIYISLIDNDGIERFGYIYL